MQYIGMQGGWIESITSFIPLICLNYHMADTDQCYMHLMYLDNTDVVSAQMNKVYSHYGNFA